MLLQLLNFHSSPGVALTLILSLAVLLLVSLPVHEFSHALVAYSLGDTTAERSGRLTLNPLRHLDPFGTILILISGFGWAKPTPVNPNRLRNGPKAGMAIVAAAGPISNFLMAFVCSLPLKFGWIGSNFTHAATLVNTGDYVALLLLYLVIFNVLLGVFNLIPLAPLDGSRLAVAVLPGEMGEFFQRIEPYGIGILMVLFALSWISPQFNVVGRLIAPVEREVVRLLLGNRLVQLLLG